MNIYFVVQIGRKGEVLGVRSVWLSKLEAENDRDEAISQRTNQERRDGWPLWDTLEREVKI